jgi:hypothetical protein
MSTAKIVVYTAISKGFDSLIPPLPLWQKEAIFVAFLEEPQPAPGWEIRPLHQEFKDPCRNAKIHKVMPHLYFPDTEYSLWIDGCIILKSTMPLGRMIKRHLARHDLALCKHPIRDSLYQEALYCLKFKMDQPEIIDRQMQRYFDEGYPQGAGLVECTVILRRHTQRVQCLNELWYKEIERGSRRDQLSFNYATHKLGLKYAHLPGTIISNPHFIRGRHTGSRFNPIKATPQTKARQRISRKFRRLITA